MVEAVVPLLFCEEKVDNLGRIWLFGQILKCYEIKIGQTDPISKSLEVRTGRRPPDTFSNSLEVRIGLPRVYIFIVDNAFGMFSWFSG